MPSIGRRARTDAWETQNISTYRRVAALPLKAEIDHPAPGMPVTYGSSFAPCAFEPNVSGRLRPTRS